MKYLYHMVPKNMEGNILMPLNELKFNFPEVYNKEVKKYEWREKVLKRRVPFLNCLWNDVLHLTAVEPKTLMRTLKDSGSKIGKIKWFKIDPSLLKSENSMVYLYPAKSNVRERMNSKYFTAFEADELGTYGVIPRETKDYYRREISEGRKPLLFHFVPHILYKGNLDVNKLEAIEA